MMLGAPGRRSMRKSPSGVMVYKQVLAAMRRPFAAGICSRWRRGSTSRPRRTPFGRRRQGQPFLAMVVLGDLDASLDAALGRNSIVHAMPARDDEYWSAAA